MVLKDLALAQKIDAGDQDAFQALYKENYPKVFCEVRRFVKDDFYAEDLTQEVFFRAYRSIDTYAGFAPIGGWLRKIARNICIDYLRKKTLPMTAWPDFTSEEGENKPREFPDESCDVKGFVESKQKLDEILGAIGSLPLHYKEAVIFCDVLDLPGQKAAKKMSCPQGTVKSRLSRARAILRADYGHILKGKPAAGA